MSVVKIIKRTNLIILGLLVVFSLAACSTAYTPDQAAHVDLVNNFNAVEETIRIHQTQPWKNNMVVMASFQSVDQNQLSSCEAVFEMEQRGIGWRVGGSGVGCSSPPAADAVTYGSGTQGVPPNALSYAHGLVKLTEGKSVDITWQDGEVQRVPVVNGSYLALRSGSFQMIRKVEVLDNLQEVISTITIFEEKQ